MSKIPAPDDFHKAVMDRLLPLADKIPEDSSQPMSPVEVIPKALVLQKERDDGDKSIGLKQIEKAKPIILVRFLTWDDIEVCGEIDMELAAQHFPQYLDDWVEDVKAEINEHRGGRSALIIH